MQLIVDIYKNTGKWYTTVIINHDKEIQMYEDNYMNFLKNSFKIPDGGYVVVRDSKENKSFHQRLYTKEMLE